MSAIQENTHTAISPDSGQVALGIVSAQTFSAAAKALLSGLAGAGVNGGTVVWTMHGELVFEPPQHESLAHAEAAIAAFSGNPVTRPGAPRATLLTANGMAAEAVLLLPPDTLTTTPTVQQLLALAGQRLSELFMVRRLQHSLKELEQAEKLQRALFAIADLAASDRDMQSLLQGLHQIIGQLMYAENFFIALYDRHKETLRFIYFVDTLDQDRIDPNQEFPVAEMENSITLAMIRRARAVRGSTNEVLAAFGMDQNNTLGPSAADFMGVPMRRDGEVIGALVVQSYHPGIGYSASDQAVLSFVAEHVLNAVERKQGQEALEQRVADRTRELAEANEKLHEQVLERERAAHLQETLYRIAALTNTQDSDEDFYRNIHLAVDELIDAENFYIALISDDKKYLEFVYSVDETGVVRKSRPLGHGMSEYVLRHSRTTLASRDFITSLIESGEVSIMANQGQVSRIWLGAPLQGTHGVMGVVAVQSYRSELSYDEQDVEVLTFVAHQIANSVERRRQAEELLAFNAELELRVETRTLELSREIAIREQIEEQLKHQVMHDPLTGLPNRLYLRDRLERALGTTHRHHKQVFSLLYLDVDRFKLFNDSYGHLVGDIVLREVARRLQECVRDPDIVARLSGDEFAILLEEGPHPSTAIKIAQRIQDRFTNPIQAENYSLQVSTSIGIAIASPNYQSIDELLHDADVALYRAKAAGRARFVLFDDSLQSSAMNVLELERQLRFALTESEFRPYFQPIVRLDDASIVGYEALIRWQHPTRGLLGPGEFLPVAEESGLIEDIDWHMYKISFEIGKALISNGEFLNINVSPRHFRHDNLAERLLALTEKTGVPPTQLHVEVTEGTLLSDPQAVARILQQLQDAGVGTALDDFGTGYSSLGYIHRFPLQIIKIDRSFIQDLDSREAQRSTAIIESILGLARALNLDVVAEGVENDIQRQALLKMGCVYAQGFFFGRPAPAAHWLSPTT